MVVGIKKLTLAGPAVAATFFAVAALSATPALADGGHNVIRADLMGSTPAPVSPVIAGVKPGGVPWVNGESEARIRDSGRTDVRIRGLIVTTTGVNPVPSVVATLVCGDMVAASTAPFALSPEGNGRTRDQIAVPMDCANPVVLIQPAANRTVYIASGMAEEDD
jgi:hypothetical protein